MFVTRLISGILLVLAAIFLFFTGGAPLVVVMGILSLIGMFELYRVLKMEKHPVATASYVASVLYYVLVYFELEQWTVALGILLLIISMILCVVKFPQYSIEEAAFGVFGFLYVSIMLSCVYMTRQLDGGNWLVWMIIIGSWGSDTCAYGRTTDRKASFFKTQSEENHRRMYRWCGRFRFDRIFLCLFFPAHRHVHMGSPCGPCHDRYGVCCDFPVW